MFSITRSPRTQRKRRSTDGTISPLEVLVELVRADDASDPFAFRFTEQTYLLRRGAGSFESAVFPWSEGVLADLATLSQARPDRVAMQRLGDTLRAFLEAASWKVDEERIVRAIEEKRGVQITVRSAAAELYALPWELVTIKATGQHLGEIPLVLLRYEWPDVKSAPRVPDPPQEGGRLLFAWSAAGGAVPAEAHLDAIARAAHEGGLPFDERAGTVPNASLRAIRKALEAEPTHVLHLLCHGGQVPSETEAYGLVLDGDDGGEPEVVDAATLRQALAPHAGSLRLVVLAACHGGSAGALGNHLASVAQALHQIGVPAVVASRYPLSIDGSIALTATLYRRMTVDLVSLEQAFVDARKKAGEEASRVDWASLQLYAHAAGGPDHRPFVFRPYRGLLAFQPSDRRFYFGREQDTRRLLQRLEKGHRLVTVVGASGSGKSSLVLAGLIPALQKSGKTFRIRVLRPGAHPCRALSSALLLLQRDQADLAPASVHGSALDDLLHRFAAQPETLADEVDRVLQGAPPETHVLLVIDQFEELFTPEADVGEVRAFLDALLFAITKPEGRTHAVITLRADFLGHSLEHRVLAEHIRETMEIALPMSEPQIREAILRPASLVGMRFEEGLVDALIDALKDEGAGEDESLSAGNLPLLQFALDELWAHRKGAMVSWASWRAIGGIRGAVAQRADQVLAKSQAADEERLVRDLFSRLVQLGEGTADTRRYATREELEAIAPGKAAGVLDRWIHSRLLTADETDVGVSHEALIREWRTLRGWINQSREALRTRQEIGQNARSWEAGKRGSEYLWRGARLRRALELIDEHKLPLSQEEKAFLDAADAEEKAIQEAEEAKRKQELETARQLLALRDREVVAQQREMESQKRFARGQRMGFGLGVMLLMVLCCSLYLWKLSSEGKTQNELLLAQKKIEIEQKNVAEATAKLEATRASIEAAQKREARRVAAAGDAVGKDPALSLALLLDLEAPEKSTQWLEVASEALWKPVTRLLLRHEGPISYAEYSPDGARIVTASADKTVRIWSADGSGAPIRFDLGEKVRLALFSPDGRSIATLTEGGKAAVRAAEAGSTAVSLGGNGDVTQLAWSPDGARVAVAQRGGTAALWSAEGSLIAGFAMKHDGEITAVSFSKDGKRVLTASQDRTARIWSEDEPGKAIVLADHRGPVIAASWSPLRNGQVLTTSDDGSARIFSADGKGRAVVLSGPWGAIHAAVWSPDEKYVVTAWEDKKLRVFSADGKGRPIELAGHGGIPRMAAWSRDVTRIVSVSDGTRPRLWSLADPGHSTLLEGHDLSAHAAAFSPEGKWVLTASADGTARVWPGDRLGAAGLIHRYESAVREVAFDATGELALALLDDGSARIWTPGSPETAMVLESKAPLSRVSFGPGKLVIGTSPDGSVRIWPDGGAGDPRVFAGHSKPVSAAALSPDGARLVTASADGTAKIWSADGTAEPKVLPHPDAVLSAAWSPDGSRVVTACNDGNARLWAASGDGDPVLLRHPGRVSSVVFSPDGATLLTASADHSARLFPADGKGDPTRLSDEEMDIVSAVFSDDGASILGISSGNSVRIWPAKGGPSVSVVGTRAALRPHHDEVLTTPASTETIAQLWKTSGAMLLSLRGHEGAITSVALSPDGRWALTGSKDRSVRLWALDPSLMREAMRGATQECLTVAQRKVLLSESEEDAVRDTAERCKREGVKAP